MTDDDPDVIYETDIADDVGVWVECEWGYERCTGADYSSEMWHHDGGWMCPSCRHTALDEEREYRSNQ